MFVVPLAICFALLLLWGALGWALIAVIEPRLRASESFLVAPVCGMAATVLPTFWLNAFGLSVASFARPLAVVLGCFTIAMWLWRRPDWNRRDWLLAVLVVLGVIMAGFPSLRFGLDWVANANDDWANYNLSAIRHLDGGFYQRPSVSELGAGRDYPGYLWFLEVASDGRPGADLLLAWVAGLVGLSPFFVFMPLILAFHGALCLASASAAYRFLGRGAALFAGLALTAFAPLSLYAVHQQLIAQVVGLAFMCALTGLTCVPLATLTGPRRLTLVTIITAAYFLVYPETVPFFALAVLIFHGLHLLNRDWGWSRLWRLGAAVLGAALLLGPYFIGFVYYLVSQFLKSGGQAEYNGVSLFPYFRVPSGLAVLFGLAQFGGQQTGAFVSIEIGFALIFLAFVLAGGCFAFVRRAPLGCYAAVFLLVCYFLVRGNNDFGLFKLACFVQPLLWFVLMSAVFRLAGRWVWLPVLALGGALVATDVGYTRASLDESAGSGLVLAGASGARLLTRLLDGNEVGCGVDLGTPLPPLAKILGAKPGCGRAFVSRELPLMFLNNFWDDAARFDALHRANGVAAFTQDAVNRLEPRPVNLRFPGLNGSQQSVRAARAPMEYGNLVQAPSFDGVLDGGGHPMSLLVGPARADSMTFVASDIGDHYYIPEQGPASLYAEERDPFYPDNVVDAVGRYLLFRVHAPSSRVRLRLDLTTTVLGDGRQRLPPAVVMGDSAVSVGLVGHGSARLLSPPFSPLVVDGIAYVLLDLGEDSRFRTTPRTGLMKLFGNSVTIDYRRFVAFARQIALVDAEQNQDGVAPSRVATFPQDLAKPHLQYSGIYEDGWAGDEGFLLLHADRPGVAVLRGMLPGGIGIDATEVAVSVNNGTPVRKTVTPGPFTVELPAPAGMSRIAFRFSHLGRLGQGDGRPAAAQLHSVALETGITENADGAATIPPVLRQLGSHFEGVYQDGWLARQGFFEVRADRDTNLVLRGVIPGNVGLTKQTVVLRGADSSIDLTLQPGEFRLVLPVKAGVTEVPFSFSQEATLPGEDGRIVSALLTSLSITAQP